MLPCLCVDCEMMMIITTCIADYMTTAVDYCGILFGPYSLLFGDHQIVQTRKGQALKRSHARRVRPQQIVRA